MAYAYFPGCTLSTKAAGYDVSGRAVAQALDMAFEELPDWQCCVATFPLATDNAMALIAPTRMLTETQKAGGHTTTLCAICYHVLKRTQVVLDRNPETLERINWFTEEPYEGGARISHFLELLRDEMGWEALSAKTVRPLTGLRVAPYYGCLLLRPENEIGLDDPDDPTILHDCLTALGCEVIDFPLKVECCGSYLSVSEPDLSAKLSEEIVDSARRRGAQVIATACPLCQFNLDYSQSQGQAGSNTKGDAFPVLYFTQLMAMALDLEQAFWGLDERYVNLDVLSVPRQTATVEV
jgi:heterodisulfide reductase subunit B